MPHAGQCHNGELQALADLHGHDLDGVGCGVVFAGALAHIERQLALVQGIGAQVHCLPVRAQDGHVAPCMAFLVGVAQLVGNGKCFFAQAGQFDEDGRLPFAATADGLGQWNAVVVFIVGRQQVRRNQAGGLQNLPGVAVVDLQDRGAALCLNADAFKAELVTTQPNVRKPNWIQPKLG